jgi:membrane-associated phospholipid phosphatase
MRFGPQFRIWCLLFGVTLVAIAVSIIWLDLPLALMFRGRASHLTSLGIGLGSRVLIAGEVAVMAWLAIRRLIKGALSPFGKATFLACSASLSSFVANDYVLKVFFGRLNPSDFFYSTQTGVFHFFQGTDHSGFPSGHMVMASAFAFAMMRLQPWTRLPLTVLLGMGAILLLVGDWHFLSDVLAGVFAGGTAGFMAGELWAEHAESGAHERAGL